MPKNPPKLSKEEFIDQVKILNIDGPRPAFVAISGFGGSGKSTLAASVAEAVGNTSVISIDDFIIGDRFQRSSDWRTFDRERLCREVLEVAQIGEMLRYQCFHSGEWVSGKSGSWREIQVSKIVIIEGCGIIHPSLTSYFSYSTWIDCPQEMAIASSKQRDSLEIELFKGEDTNKLWDDVWGPNDKDFLDKFKPDKFVDVLVEKQF